MAMEFKTGDRVTANHHLPRFAGRTGTVKYVSGPQYWVMFDGEIGIEPGLYGWWLEPVSAKTRNEARAA